MFRLFKNEKIEIKKKYDDHVNVELKAMKEKLDHVHRRMFLDNGTKSVASIIAVNEDNIKENREAIRKLDTEVNVRFNRVDDKIDKLDDSLKEISKNINEVSAFNILNLVNGFFTLGKNKAFDIIKIAIIFIIGLRASPYIQDQFTRIEKQNGHPEVIRPTEP